MCQRKGWGTILLIIAVIVLWFGGNTYADGLVSGETIYQLPVSSQYTRLVIKYRYLPVDDDVLLLGSSISLRVIDRIDALNAVVAYVPTGYVGRALSLLRNSPDVVYAEVDHVVQAAFTPNDPDFNLHQYAPQIVQADKAWDVTRGSPEIVVAVIDTGVDYMHPDLNGKVILGYDFVNDDPDPMDDNGHGTHVAGIIGAVTNNGVGVAGIGYNTRVMAVKVLSATGGGFYSTVARGITYAVDNGARVINLSLRGTVDSSILQDAVNYAWSKGVLVVAAAGNDGSNAPVYPAVYPHVLAVAATDWNDNYWSLSNYGDFVDVSAPGVGIYSTDWSGGAGPYASRSGTSMAAPHVAGVAALALAVNSDLTNAELEALLMDSVDDLGDAGWDPYYGTGRVNAYKAVLAAQKRDVVPASVSGRVWVDRNGNGIREMDENGKPGVIVELHRQDDSLAVSTTTDTGGFYTFNNVEPGIYHVRIVSPAGYVFTLAHQGVDETRDSDVARTTGATGPFTLEAGDTLDNLDTGLIPTGQISGLIWIDPNANNVQDPGETNTLADVSIRVLGTNVLGENINVTVLSDAQGYYVVSDLLPGTYRVEVSDQVPGYVVTSPNPQEVVLTADVLEVTGVNFGFIAPTVANLVAFTITPSAHVVTMGWKVSLNGGAPPAFHVWRSEDNVRWTRLTDTALLPVEDNGYTAEYRYADDTVQPGHTYAYRLAVTGGETFGPWTTHTPSLEAKPAGLNHFLPLLAQ